MKKNLTIIILLTVIGGLCYLILAKTDLALRIANKIYLEYGDHVSTIKPLNEIGDTYGIDISHHQGDIDWSKVDSWEDKKISFVYIKATEGTTYKDNKYKQNFKEAKKHNFLVGSYHYFRTTSDIKDQFDNFINSVDKNEQDLLPLIDVEEKDKWGDTEFHNNLQEFLNMVENHFGVKPIIYSVNSFYNNYLSGKYSKYHFLIGRYGENQPNMRDDSNWTIWQFTETGKVEGIPKSVDIDVVNGTYSIEELKIESNS
jgi:lysozyme